MAQHQVSFSLRPYKRPEFELSISGLYSFKETLEVSAAIEGDLAQVIVPSEKTGEELWKHTCFEVFLGDDSSRYCEFNFSPAGEWRHYDFESYRKPGSTTQPEVTFETQSSESVSFKASLKTELKPTKIGLSAVIETPNGLHYFALSHPADKLDFHHSNGWQSLSNS